MNIHVKGPRVLVLPRPEPEQDPEALIHRAEAFQQNAPVTMGQVLQLGDEPTCPFCQKGRAFEVQVGDMVVFPPSTGEFVYVDDDRYLILDHRDISAVLTKEPGA